MIPHVFIPARWERYITGHMGFTYLCLTFVALTKEELRDPIHDGFKRHEHRHVQQSLAVTAAWLLLAISLTSIFTLSALWWLTALAAWPLVYWAASVRAKVTTGKGYTDNWFESDARRYAGQP